MAKSQGLDIDHFDYNILPTSIANTPAIPRDSSKLMVVDRNSNKAISLSSFRDITKLLDSNTVLVLNNTKVFPARVFAQKPTGGKIELLFLTKTAKNTWECMHKGKVNFGDTLYLGSIELKVVSHKEKLINVTFSCRENELFSHMKKYGLTPLPPYIKPTQDEKTLQKEYQTIYAKHVGSAAAPTAGFHFTKDLLKKLESQGVIIEYITLHVGLGTFAPVTERDITKHKIHEEVVMVDAPTAARLNKYKEEGKQIVAIGTTTLRTLESVVDTKGQVKGYLGKTNIFIYPPYKFKFVDHLITNFHLPKSTLLALVSAFSSYPNTNIPFTTFANSLLGKAYKRALKENYRFFSFGDAMYIK